jgi:putative FmdB family regulatory protein
MKEYEYVCQECGQRIEVNGPMREAILENGCPVCSASAQIAHFSGQ